MGQPVKLSDGSPHRFCLAMGHGKVLETAEPLPEWVRTARAA
jgi:hypothetical protein